MVVVMIIMPRSCTTQIISGAEQTQYANTVTSFHSHDYIHADVHIIYGQRNGLPARFVESTVYTYRHIWRHCNTRSQPHICLIFPMAQNLKQKNNNNNKTIKKKNKKKNQERKWSDDIMNDVGWQLHLLFMFVEPTIRHTRTHSLTHTHARTHARTHAQVQTYIIRSDTRRWHHGLAFPIAADRTSWLNHMTVLESESLALWMSLLADRLTGVPIDRAVCWVIHQLRGRERGGGEEGGEGGVD